MLCTVCGKGSGCSCKCPPIAQCKYCGGNFSMDCTHKGTSAVSAQAHKVFMIHTLGRAFSTHEKAQAHVDEYLLHYRPEYRAAQRERLYIEEFDIE